MDRERAWAVEDIGGRAHMEDAHVLLTDFGGKPGRILGGVFDGHGGADVARLAGKRLPELLNDVSDPEDAFRRAYGAIDRETEALRGGAVAATFLLDGEDLTVANAGDAHIVLVTTHDARQLTEQHRLENDAERARVVAAGALLWGPYACLPDGNGLMATRSLGDHALKSIGIHAGPYTARHRTSPTDLYLVAACDGLWDVMTPREVGLLVRAQRTAEEAAIALRHEALDVRRTGDNLTILVLRTP